MGKLILCCGKMAERPYHFPMTNTNVYSIEELTYYIYHHIYTIYQDTFSEELVEWLRDELDLPELSMKLKELIHHGNSLKDMVVTLFCASDYYGENEIKETIRRMDEINGLTPLQRHKMKADHYLKYRCFAQAEQEYVNIFSQHDPEKFTNLEYGDLLHNQGVVKLHTANAKEAAHFFWEAYQKNQEEESLKEYLYCLKLAGMNAEFEREVQTIPKGPEFFFELTSEYQETMAQLEGTPVYQKYKKAMKSKQEGKMTEFYRGIDEIIENWKQEYRAQ